MSDGPLVVVVGAGMAGLAAARELNDAGAQVVVVDKGRGVGGRLASRRIDGAVFDHGAQFFTARSPGFATVVRGWVDAGSATAWFTGVLGGDGIVDAGPTSDETVRLRGVPSMTGIAKHMADDLDVRLSSHVVSMRPLGDRWQVQITEGDDLSADAVVLTAPAPQTLAMLDDASLDPADLALLDRIEFDPCIAVLAVLDRSPSIGAPGARRPSAEPVAWYADNQAKGVSEVPALTVHAGPSTSRAMWDSDPDDVVDALLGGLDLGGAAIVRSQVHRWRFAQPATWHPEPTLVLRGVGPAAVAGDAFGGSGRVEGAALSGWAAATAIARRLGLTEPDGPH